MIFGIDQDLFLGTLFLILVVLFSLMFLIGLPRGKRLQDTNAQIAANQERLIALQDRRAKLVERQVDALERIAAALETR